MTIIIIDTTKLFKFTPEEEAYLSRMEKVLPYHRRIDHYVCQMIEERRNNLIRSLFIGRDKNV